MASRLRAFSLSPSPSSSPTSPVALPRFPRGAALRLAAALALLGNATACKHEETSGQRALPRDFVDVHDAVVVVAPVPRPQSPAQASVMIAEAVARLQASPRDGSGALARIEAVLRCDFLTDHGRADLYWLAADAAADIDDARRREHLAGFLIAASVLPRDVELNDRMRRARMQLLASQVRAGVLGQSPERAIGVDNRSEADSLVAQLGCGADGHAAYVERHGVVTASDERDALTPRRFLCTENGDELVLWFRVGADVP